MMQRLFLTSTAVFWLAVLGFWIGSLSAPIAQPPAAPSMPDRAIGAAELAQHATPQSCWMAINGAVYDITGYLPDHPSRPQIIEAWCGKEASDAYATKTRGRPHSHEADQLLPKYRIGRFGP
ncbi:MAG: cytochrome b5 domain-containing protein [Rhodopseudomonas palustris]|nr:MAG: cytochrome b5 domain-containing protein [Rhodopseudomonas palustris]